jgi:aspartate/methionine/tyrosine aminotransferase
MFEPLSYLDWIVERRDVPYNLGESVLSAVTYEGRSFVPAPLEDLPDPPGDVEFGEQVAAAYGVGPEEVQVTAGASHANFALAMAAVTDARERGQDPRVLVEAPGYQPLVESPRGLGATVDRFPRVDTGVADGERSLAAAVEARLTDATALVTVTNRHNPTGRLLEREDLRPVAEAARARDALLLVDEVYAPFTLEDDVREGPGTAFGGPTAAGLPNTVVTASFTKFFGLGAIRLGWMVAAPEVLDRVRPMFGHLPVTCPVAVPHARRLLHNADRFADGQRDLLARNHDLLASFAAGAGLEGTVAPGSHYALLGHPSADGDRVVEAAIDAGVLVVPGRFFGVPDRFRICCGVATGDVREGLDRLDDAIAAL